MALCGALQVQFATIRECTTKLFKDGAKIAGSSQTESKVRKEDTLRTESQIARRSRHLCAIFATLFTKVIRGIVQGCQSSQHCSKRNAERLERCYKESWLPLLPVHDPAEGLGMVKWGAAFTMVSVGYLEATLSWAVIVFP